MKYLLFTAVIGMALAGPIQANDHTNWQFGDRRGDGTGGGQHAGDPSADGTDPGMGVPGAAGGSDGDVADTDGGGGVGTPYSPIGRVRPGSRGNEGRNQGNAQFTNWQNSQQNAQQRPPEDRSEIDPFTREPASPMACNAWGRVCRDGSAAVRVSDTSCRMRCPEDSELQLVPEFRDGP